MTPSHHGNRASRVDRPADGHKPTRREPTAAADTQHEQLADTLDSLFAEDRVCHFESLIGRRIAHYTVDREIGFGAFGIVYKAWDEKRNREVAIKAPRPEIVSDEDLLARFDRESNALRQLDDPRIVRLLRFSTWNAKPYLVMEYCDGIDLEKWLDVHSLPEMDDAVSLVIAVGEALQHAHEHGVIHRDVKPSNLLLVLRHASAEATTPSIANYDVRVTDFGLALVTQAALSKTQSSLVVGTPLYMAPEQLQSAHAKVSPATDVFALGAVLYRLLVGHPPCWAFTYHEVVGKLQTGDFPSPMSERPDVPKSLNAICLQCLQLCPEDRYASAAELVADLKRFQEGQPVKASTTRWIPSLRRWLRHPQRRFEACIAIIALSVVRCVWSFVGFATLMSLEAIRPTRAQAIEAICSHLFLTVPLEILIVLAACRLNKYQLQDRWYYAGLSLFITMAAVTFLIALGGFVPSGYYQSHETARVVSFSFVATVFAAQAIAWIVAGQRWWSRRPEPQHR